MAVLSLLLLAVTIPGGGQDKKRGNVSSGAALVFPVPKESVWRAAVGIYISGSRRNQELIPAAVL